jgi:hypothetical protein
MALSHHGKLDRVVAITVSISKCPMMGIVVCHATIASLERCEWKSVGIPIRAVEVAFSLARAIHSALPANAMK